MTDRRERLALMLLTFSVLSVANLNPGLHSSLFDGFVEKRFV